MWFPRADIGTQLLEELQLARGSTQKLPASDAPLSDPYAEARAPMASATATLQAPVNHRIQDVV